MLGVALYIIDLYVVLFFIRDCAHRDLHVLTHSFPTRRSSDLIMVSGDINVMNPNHVICHLDEGATLNMELVADTGKGYVPATGNRPADAPIGLDRKSTRLNSSH